MLLGHGILFKNGSLHVGSHLNARIKIRKKAIASMLIHKCDSLCNRSYFTV